MTDRPNTQRVVVTAVAGTIVAIALVWLAMSFTYPFGWDQGLFAWVGGVIVNGGMPYVDAWEFKGPLVYYLYALAQALFGVHMWSVRVLDVALLLMATASVRRVAATLTDDGMAWWAASVFFLWYASQSYWHTAQPDGWTGMLLIAGLAPVFSRTPRMGAGRMALAGAAVGAVTLFKPVYALFLSLPIVYVALTRWPSRARSIAAVTAGWALPIGLMTAWFALRGALSELIAVHLGYSTLYLGLSPGARFHVVSAYSIYGTILTVVLPIAAFGSVVLWNRNRPVAIVLAAWIGLAVFFVVLQKRYYAYHWLPILPPATVLATVGIHDLARRMKPLGYAIGASILLRCIAPIVVEEVRYAEWITGRINRTAYYEAYGVGVPASDIKAVEWLKERGKPGSVFVFGFHSGIGWLSERGTVSRFGYSLPLMLGNGPLRSRYRGELMDNLRTVPPQYIVVTRQSPNIVGRRITVDDFPELVHLLGTYRPVQRFRGITIYELNRTTPARSPIA